MQIQDLARAYQAKTDEELLQLANSSTQLMPEALSVLIGELTRRRLDVGSLEAQKELFQEAEPRTIVKTGQSVSGSVRVGAFVPEVVRLYHRRFWFFVKLIFPAVLVGCVAVIMGRSEGREIARHIPLDFGIVSHRTEVIEIVLVNLTSYLVSWMIFSLSFGAISFAVAHIETGRDPTTAEAVAAVRQRVGTLSLLALLLFFLMLAAIGAAGLITTGVIWASHEVHIRLSPRTVSVLSVGVTSVAILILSRFALAIPAVVLDNCKVSEALFRSDQLTERKWLILAVLLAKSIIGGYVAGISPFWLARFIPASIALPLWFGWALTLASVAAVSVVEPPMFIGFVLLYLRTSAVARSPAEVAAQSA